MQLITYVDRLAGDLKSLKSLLDNEFSDLFSGVHLLPFFYPIDGADAGFDPIDHTSIDARLGSWSDMADLASDYSVMADLIVNHVSVHSPQFKDVLAKGESSIYWPLFLKKSDVFPNENDLDVQKIYRPRPTQPFTRMELASGQSHEFWTTFSQDQIDINVESEQGVDYLNSVLDCFAKSGIKEIRLDAAGYCIKRQGTRCFMLPETFNFIDELSTAARERDMTTLVEIHSHYLLQIQIACRVGKVYDFALPPLVLHAIFQADAQPLKAWLSMSPRNCITVLDTHDGIGILDVAKDGDNPGLLSDVQIDQLVERIHSESNDQSREASGSGANNLDVYQINCTFYDALGQSDIDYLIARAIQFFVPGKPQIYYMGLLVGVNDLALVNETKVGRDINRRVYSTEDLASELARPVVKDTMSLIRLRNSSRAFSGEFSVESSADDTLRLSWSIAGATALLHVNFSESHASIEFVDDGRLRRYEIGAKGLSELNESSTGL